MPPALAVAASLQLTLLLSCALVVAITVAIAVARRHPHHAETPGPVSSTGSPPPEPPPDRTPLWPVPTAVTSPPSPAAAESPVTPAPRPSRSPLVGARYGPDTFALVAEHADHTQRLAVAEARVERVLATLPSEGWFVQRFALVAGDRIPFLVLGEYGVFAIWAIGWRPQWTDPAFVSRIASNLKRRLPDYPGPVNAGLCGFLQPDIEPRYWYRCGTDGAAWILGLDWLLPWMEHFGHQHGLGTDDIKHFRALAKPDWSRPVAPVPPGIPIINTAIRTTE
jgi:hypothetical protein